MTRHRKFRPYEPFDEAVAASNALDREQRRREAEEDAALDRLEPEQPRPNLPSGVDHSRHHCNNDPADPWSECTVERPY